MPELPEVETMCRGVRTVVGHRVRSLRWFDFGFRPLATDPSPSRIAQAARGRTIRDVQRLGKRIVLRLDDGNVLVFEPRMTGLLLLADPPDQEHLRLAMQLDGPSESRLQFWDRRGLGTIQWLSPQQVLERLGGDRLGPDALQLEAGQLRERLRGTRRAVKVALLDQRILTGIGNLYAAEILHVAAIHPETRCDRLSVRQTQRLHAALREVLLQAIRDEGSTLGDGTYRTALNQSGRYQNRHRVYARADQPCPSCGRARIRRIVQAQRATFFCPNCQRKRDRRRD